MRRGWVAPRAPLSGVVAVVLIVVAFGPVGGSTPNATDSLAKVSSFYHGHYDREIAAGVMALFAALFIVWFGVVLRQALIARDPAAERLANVVMVAGAMLGLALAVLAGAHFALNDSVHHNYLGAVPALNVLDNDLFTALIVPLVLIVAAIAAASLRYGLFSRWVGWIAVVILVSIITPAAFGGVIASMLLLLAVSVIVYQWERRPATRPPVAPTAAERVEVAAV